MKLFLRWQGHWQKGALQASTENRDGVVVKRWGPKIFIMLYSSLVSKHSCTYLDHHTFDELKLMTGSSIIDLPFIQNVLCMHKNCLGFVNCVRIQISVKSKNVTLWEARRAGTRMASCPFPEICKNSRKRLLCCQVKGLAPLAVGHLQVLRLRLSECGRSGSIRYIMNAFEHHGPRVAYPGGLSIIHLYEYHRSPTSVRKLFWEHGYYEGVSRWRSGSAVSSIQFPSVSRALCWLHTTSASHAYGGINYREWIGHAGFKEIHTSSYAQQELPYFLFRALRINKHRLGGAGGYHKAVLRCFILTSTV